jgi:hypothetical protein
MGHRSAQIFTDLQTCFKYNRVMEYCKDKMLCPDGLTRMRDSEFEIGKAEGEKITGRGSVPLAAGRFQLLVSE